MQVNGLLLNARQSSSCLYTMQMQSKNQGLFMRHTNAGKFCHQHPKTKLFYYHPSSCFQQQLMSKNSKMHSLGSHHNYHSVNTMKKKAIELKNVINKNRYFNNDIRRNISIRKRYRNQYHSLALNASNSVTTRATLSMEKGQQQQHYKSKDEIVVNQQSPLSNGELPKNLVLCEEIGNGTFGTVFLAIDKKTGEQYAIKVVSKTRSGRDGIDFVTQKVEHEVAMWCEIQDSINAVKLEKFYEDDKNFYLVQELCKGGSLEDLIKKNGKLNEVQSGQATSGILSLLCYCHSRNICYGDVKPANFMLSHVEAHVEAPQEQQNYNHSNNNIILKKNEEEKHLIVKAVDFGSCQRVVGRGIKGEKGTPLYMAPEVQSSVYGLKSDIWSVGILLYHMISGQLPFINSVCNNDLSQLTPAALSFAMAYATLSFEGEAWEDVSDDVKDLIAKMLERDVSQRISAQEALEHNFIKTAITRTIPQTTFSDICPMEDVLQKKA